MEGIRVLRVAATAAALAVLAGAARAQELPEGVTEAMIKEGATLFSGAGICMACHGPDGKGIPNLGADLTDDEWVHSDGSFEGIVKTILEGVAADKSTTGTVMPPKGGSALNESQIKAVAAYVWSLRRKG